MIIRIVYFSPRINLVYYLFHHNFSSSLFCHFLKYLNSFLLHCASLYFKSSRHSWFEPLDLLAQISESIIPPSQLRPTFVGTEVNPPYHLCARILVHTVHCPQAIFLIVLQDTSYCCLQRTIIIAHLYSACFLQQLEELSVCNCYRPIHPICLFTTYSLY